MRSKAIQVTLKRQGSKNGFKAETGASKCDSCCICWLHGTILSEFSGRFWPSCCLQEFVEAVLVLFCVCHCFWHFSRCFRNFFAFSRLPVLFKSIVWPSHGFQLRFKRFGSFHYCPEAVLVASGTIPGLFESIFCFLMALNAVWKHFLTKLLLAAPLEAFKKLSAPFEMS